MASEVGLGSRPSDGQTEVSEVVSAPNDAGPAVDLSNQGQNKAVDEVLYSDIGVNTLLNRLKQSITSVQDFAGFLQKRSKLEEDQAQGLKKLSKSTQEALGRRDSRQGTYAQHFNELTRYQDRLGDNSIKFALGLHQMHEDLDVLAKNMEAGRKQWKHVGLAAEKKAQDAESAMAKAKAKYDSLAEDYDRVKTGDKATGRGFGLRGPKSVAQQEEDLHRKVQIADSDYKARVEAAKVQRQELLTTSRPQAIRAIRELVSECDSALTFHLQKFASLSEKTLLANGLTVSPLEDSKGNGTTQRSLRELIADIDNKNDFDNDMLNSLNKVPHRSNDIRYIPHPTLASSEPQAPPPQMEQPSQPSPSQNQHYGSSFPGFASFPPTSTPQAQTANGLGRDEKSYSPTPQYQQQTPPASYGFSQGSTGYMQSVPGYTPSPVTYGSKETGPLSPNQMTGTTRGGDLPPLRPVFGLTLDELFRRDGTAVPLVVYQCLQAVDLFGLDVEGIYRLSGTTSHANALKALFNHDSSIVDFRNPEAFFHDVNSVAGLLKQFFRELPDPLLTIQHYTGFIEAARIDDDIVRRDSLHAIVNELPDPNYATLRALILHLHRVQEHSQNNRMSSSNLAICFAPTLMGQHRGGQVADAALQARVVDTILQNTLQIFDED